MFFDLVSLVRRSINIVSGLMLPKELKAPFLSFLSEIDRFISASVCRGRGGRSEPAVTEDLLACLDEKIEGPEGLRIRPENFRVALQEAASDLSGDTGFNIRFDTEGFSQIYEGRVTQADYALHLSFTDTSKDLDVGNRCSWDALYFMQAKVARPAGNRVTRDKNKWTGSAKFKDTGGQALAIEVLRSIIGDSGLLYNLYCPTSAMMLSTQGHVLRRLCDSFHKTSEEWSLAENAGLWLSGEFQKNLDSLFTSDDKYIYPWSLFIMDHYFMLETDEHSLRERSFRDEGKTLEYAERMMLYERRGSVVENVANRLVAEGLREKVIRDYNFTRHDYRGRVEIEIRFPAYDYTHKPSDPAP